MEERKKQARMVDPSSTMVDLLPLHILMEIISRLPIQTIMAIRCVCKSLLSLISDSHFQMLHSTRARTVFLVSAPGESSTTLCILMTFLKTIHVLQGVDAKCNVVFELPSFRVTSGNCCVFGATKSSILRFVNSCHGLVCYMGPYRSRFVVICNPFTHEYITFPCPARIDKTIEKWNIFYGLGFSPKDNKFKLLRVVCPKSADPDSDSDYVEVTRLVAEIYTFGEGGSSSWKRVANRPELFLGQEKVIFHEGVLHWDRDWRYGSIGIHTFGFDTELFGKLATPICMSGMSESDRIWSSAVGLFNNRLCISGCVGDFVEVWSLKKYGDQGSWVKIFSIPKDTPNTSRGSYAPFKTVNGLVLMFKKIGLQKSGHIVIFGPDTGRVKVLDGIRICDGPVFIRPSLVSLKVLLGDNVMVHCQTTLSDAPKDRRAGQSSSETQKLADDSSSSDDDSD